MADQMEQDNNEQQMEQQYAEQLEMERRQQLMKQAGQLGQQTALGEAKDKAVELAKQQVKKTILKWLAGIILSIFGNPITWIIVAIVIVALIAGWCVDESIDCVKD
ncbi:MAG: hypothetical protein ACOZAJ_03110, partial [Patescibacteria group bacterium]